MTKRQRQKPAPSSPPAMPPIRFLSFVQAMIIVVIAASAYLLWTSLQGGTVAGCGPDSPCDRVLSSKWAYWFGIPVSALALVLYLGMLAATFGTRPELTIQRQKLSRALLSMFAIMVAGAALWFIALQFLVIRGICPYCMLAQAGGLVIAALLLFPSRVKGTPGKARKELKTERADPLARKLSLVALASLAVLIVGPIIHTPRTHLAQSTSSVTDTHVAMTNPPPATSQVAGAKPAPQPPSPVRKERFLSLHDGEFRFNVYDLPVIGSPEAPNVIFSLFDYTCKYCRIMHGHLMQAIETFGNRLAFVSLPVPLDSSCNRTIRRTLPDHTDACQYARLGLAVWRAAPQKHRTFDEWVFSLETPPALGQTRRHAENLVGKEALEQALADEWIDRQMQWNIRLYETHWRKFRRDDMPQLLIGSQIFFGVFKSVDVLYRTLDIQLGLKR